MSELRLTEEQLDRARRTCIRAAGGAVELRESFNQALRNAGVTVILVKEDQTEVVVSGPPTPRETVMAEADHLLRTATNTYGLYLSTKARSGIRELMLGMFRLGEQSRQS